MSQKTTVLIAVGCLALGAFLGGGAQKIFISDPAARQLKLESECDKCAVTLGPLWRLRNDNRAEAISSLESSQDSAVAKLAEWLPSTAGSTRETTGQWITNVRKYRLKYPAPPPSTNPPTWTGPGVPAASSPSALEK